MLRPINSILICSNSLYQPNVTAKNRTETTSQPFELSGADVGRAILARNNVSFRNLSIPIEVTDRYNKNVSGNNHLNLPNVHIYEYPDTNLQIIINLADKIDTPHICTELCNYNQKHYSPLISKLIEIIIENKLKNIDNNAFCTSDKNIFSYQNKNNIKSISKFNEIVFNPNMNKKDLSNAKAELIKYFNSKKYINTNADLKYLYPANTFKTNKQLINDLNNISLNDIINYHESYLNNSEGTVYLSLSKENFVQNKKEIFNLINKNIPIKLQPNKCDYNNEDEFFIPNQTIRIIRGIEGITPMSLDYKIHFENTKQEIISDLAETILYGDKYMVMKKYYNNPLNIKNANDINTCMYQKIYIDIPKKEKIDINKELKEFNSYVHNILNSDIYEEVNKLKETYKKDIKYDLTETNSGFDRIMAMKGTENFYKYYEIIDSVSDKDVKNYIEKYFSNQKPIIHLHKVEN